MSTLIVPKFSEITESPFTRATSDQLQILYTRYDLATKHSVGKDVIEVACGAGVGLGMIAGVGRHVTGGDIDDQNCATALESYAGRPNIEVRHVDALQLPFGACSFDVVVLYEALYYLPSADEFLREARRVLRPGGTLLISTVNCRWGEFNASPFSTRYFDAAELAGILVRQGFDVSLYGGFPEKAGGAGSAVIGAVRKAAVRLHLIPGTQKRKEWLKRIFYGELQQIPRELKAGLVAPAPLDPLEPPYAADQFRFIYAVAVLP